MNRLQSFVVAVVVVALAETASANLVNGGFETGDFTGWTTTTAGDARPIAIAIGSTVSDGGTIPPSLTNNRYAYTSQTGPGQSFLTQAFTVQAGINRIFFDLFVRNSASAFATPDSLSYLVNPNQQARVDIIRAGAPVTTTDPADIIVAAFRTQVGDPLVQPWRTFELDVTSQLAPFVGQVVVFRFAQVDNQNYFNFGIDNVNVGVTQVPPVAAAPTQVPTLSEWGFIVLSGLLMLATFFATMRPRRR